MRVYAKEGLRYMPCPTVKHKRYKEVAQMRCKDGHWHCTACTKDHITKGEIK
jgi:hypothetical protein